YFFPYWRPIEDEHFSVQQSKFIVEAPLGYKLRYKEFNYSGNVSVIKNEKSTYTWQLLNKTTIEYELFQPPVQEINTMVYIAPSEFEFGGYKGDMSTWDGLGKF